MKYKSIIAVASIMAFAACQTQENGLTVNVNIENLELPDGESVEACVMVRGDGQWDTAASATLVDGAATLHFELDEPTFYYIQIENLVRPVSGFGQHGSVDAYADASAEKVSLRLSGTTEIEVLNEIDDKQKEMQETMTVSNDLFQSAQVEGDSAVMDSLLAHYEVLESDFMSFVAEKAQTSGTVGAFIASRYLYMADYETVAAIYSQFGENDTTSVVLELGKRVGALESIQVGKPFVDFTQLTPEGENLSVSDIAIERYLLVDFWASWCGPCRAENPNWVKLYADYSEHGLEIVGVSFDRDGDAWKKAIEDDQLTWHHMSVLQGWDNDAREKYAINAIPQNVLIGADGTILAHNVTSDELRDMLSE